MVAEDEVPPTTVDIDLRAKISHGHRGALDVPSWPPLAKPRRLSRLIRRRPAPQWEIQCVLFGPRPDSAQRSLLAQLANHRAARSMRQAPIAAVQARIEIEAVGSC